MNFFMKSRQLCSLHPQWDYKKEIACTHCLREVVTALNDLLRLADRSGLCPSGESRCEMDRAREVLAKGRAS